MEAPDAEFKLFFIFSESAANLQSMKRLHLSIAMLAILFSAASNGYAQEDPIPKMIAQVQPSVVTVFTDQSYYSRYRNRSFLHRFWLDFYERKRRIYNLRYDSSHEGAGFVITSNGLVLTNEHVVRDAETIEVELHDNRRLKAKLIGKDIAADLALLATEPEQALVPVQFADMDRAKVGEEVIAIGSPLSYRRTVTKGIISALNAEYRRNRELIFQGLIQTDVAVNPGNSGGPLLNSRGEVLGMVTLMERYAQGIGFAIPADQIQSLIPQLQNAEVNRIELLQRFQSEFGFSPVAKKDQPDVVLISGVRRKSPADAAGLRNGDRLIQFGDMRIKGPDHLLNEYETASWCDARTEIRILRDDNRYFTYLRPECS